MRIRNVPLRSFGPYSRYRGYRGFGAFGTTSPATGADCPPSGDWNKYCDCVWPANSADAAINKRCKGWGIAAPWTIVGAAMRGIPQGESITAAISGGIQIISQLTGGAVPGVPQPPIASAYVIPTAGGSVAGASSVSTPTTADPGGGGGESSIFGIPKTIAYVGGGVLALGVVALVLSGAGSGGKKRR